MSALDQLLRRPVATSLAAIGLVLLGALAYPRLPVADMPTVDLPTIIVQAGLPGASPETMATLVATPLERRIGQIAGVTELTSVNVLGGTQIAVQLSSARDVAGAAADVQSAVNAASSDLPKDMPARPHVIKINSQQMPIMFLVVTSDTLPADVVYGYAERVIAQRIAQIDGVGRAAIEGAQKYAVRVSANAAMLAGLGLGLDDVRGALVEANALIPKGTIEGVAKSQSVAANDQLLGVEDYRQLPIVQRDGTIVRLGNLAKVAPSVVNDRVAGWLNDKPAMFVVVQREAGANAVQTAERVRAVLPQLQKWLPPAIKVAVLADRTDTIRARIADAQWVLLITTIVVALVILLFLRSVRAALMPTVAIPVSIVGTVGLMFLFGFTLNDISLAALTVCVGFVVDDAIVVIENVARHREMGLSPNEAALIGTRQVTFTIVSITGSLVAALVPLILVSGVVGQFLREFSVTLSSAIVISAVVSLTLTPVMCAKLVKREGRLRDPGQRGLLTSMACIDRLADFIVAGYAASLRWVLRRHAVIGVIAVATTLVTIVLYVVVPKGFLPPQDSGVIAGIGEASQDVSFTAMTEHQKAVVQVILDDPAVLSVVSYIGTSGEPASTNKSRFYVALKPFEQRPSLEDVITRLRPQLAQIAGISTYLQSLEDVYVGAREGKGKFQFTLQDDDWSELERYYQLVIARLREIPGLMDVGSDQRTRGLQTFLEIDRDRASTLGVTPQAIDDALYSSFGQRQVSRVYTDADQFQVVLEIEQTGSRDPAELQRVWISSDKGDQVPLSSVTRAVTKTTALSISHQGQFPAITITFNLAPNVALSTATNRIRQEVEKLKLPPGLRTSFEGTARAFASSSGSEPWLILAAVLTIYIVLGVLYESYVHPLTILSSLPAAGIGGILAVMITGRQFTLICFVALILLLGIVKKNAIMMVDFALAAERSGTKTQDAIYQACLIRFRPIIMTTMTALIGSLPLALDTGEGSAIRQSFGIVIIGGLITSQLLTLYTTPVIYIYMDRVGRWFRQRRLGRKLPDIRTKAVSDRLSP
ncbi:MAG TPA: efflux RND transporter permease subunit [Xanthobacteraceae bacterium]|jgi:hydrophobe/amphiphile efflux-1 (HAE1) family protein